MRNLWFLTAILLVVQLLVGCTQPQSGVGDRESVSSTVDIVSFTIRITEDGFIPSTLDVYEGDRVQITFVTEDPYNGEHPIRLTGYGYVGQLNLDNPEISAEFTVEKVDAYRFFCGNVDCDIHEVLRDGRIIVK